MSCTNCFNGCTETISDQCVVYTGTDVPSLGIHTNDSLLVVEQSLITFLISALNGSGTTIDLSGIDVCALVQNYLPSEGEIVLTDVLEALILASCDIQAQLDVVVSDISDLNSPYTIPVDPVTGPCLTGVTSSSDTHDIVQAIIAKVCTTNSSVDTIVDQLPLFVTKSEFCTLLAQCTSNTPTTVLASDKMLPFAVVPYYGPTNGYPTVNDTFDDTGAGTGYWARVFMCNGQNGTPDLRGRVPVGATDTPSTNGFPAQTNPGVDGNPVYTYNTTPGTNRIRLELPQIPVHNHVGSSVNSTVNDPKHSHAPNSTGDFAIYSGNEGENGSGSSGNEVERDIHPARTTSEFTGITVNTTLTIANAGQSDFHPNVQPGFALYYIQYRP
jgi:microcystin-dependent protein